MFTDWTTTDPHYFYWRGALYGVVVATLFWRVLVPWIWRRATRGQPTDATLQTGLIRPLPEPEPESEEARLAAALHAETVALVRAENEMARAQGAIAGILFRTREMGYDEYQQQKT